MFGKFLSKLIRGKNNNFKFQYFLTYYNRYLRVVEFVFYNYSPDDASLQINLNKPPIKIKNLPVHPFFFEKIIT